MRALLIALAMTTAPAALNAQILELTAHPDHVTVYPQGAKVSRRVEVAGEGTRQILIPDLPRGTDISTLRFAGEGVQVGGATLIDGRLPASEGAISPAIEAARAEVERLEAALAIKEDDLRRIHARAEAARAQIGFWQGLEASAESADQVASLAQAVGAGTLAATEAAIAAEAEYRAADLALRPDREALEKARQALAALEHPSNDKAALMLWVSGSGTLEISSFVPQAGWQPSYDLRYDEAARELRVSQYFELYQHSGEDWTDVALTISAARPADRAAPSEVWPRLLHAMPDRPIALTASKAATREMMAEADGAVFEAAPAPEMIPELKLLGEIPTFEIAQPRDLRDGVEGFRVEWQETRVPAAMLAEVAPLYDDHAYRVIEGEAPEGTFFFPGSAMIWQDGSLIGRTDLPFVRAGDEMRVGLGPIETLRATRLMPETMEGDKGVISRSNTRREVVEIEVSNDSGRDWAVRVIDRLPYSEQEDLTIETTATPAPTARDLDDKRGVIAWEFDLAKGAAKTLRTETEITWPIDQILR
ncbi:MAG: DUF4139 domain-containing protein [Paracoccaceae bacterium]